ncbi:hypothetical protein LIER_32311 [Lithospermum erythrorhizon]|uniref:Uncharacterized protein n=1 Tax=Lithospermum erythrorhizon TaxID=34254 RepID=A0AAV3RTH5_LITER
MDEVILDSLLYQASIGQCNGGTFSSLAYTYANSNVAKWKEKPIPFYDKLEELFGKDRATADNVVIEQQEITL